MFIGQLKTIDDLADGGRAIPEPDMGYELRTIDGSRFEEGTVEYVVRRGNVIFAQTTAGEEFVVSGKDTHVNELNNRNR